jgi:hypothetical protein
VLAELTELWLAAATRLSMPISRGGEAYVHWDGERLHIADDAELDPDDSVAQLTLHEICHALIEGPDAFRRPDWGLDNTSERDAERERAAVRLQAHLLGAWGLRDHLFPTTSVRAFYEALPADALFSPTDPGARLARRAARAAAAPPWGAVLQGALADTAAALALPRHPNSELPLAAAPDWTCGGCVWRTPGGFCRQATGRVWVDSSERACVRWERALDCLACGACCREAYDVVEVARRSALSRRHPALVVDRGGRLELRRVDGRCAALVGPDGGPFHCVVYDDRPRTCREFALGGRHCLTARRRVGLSF